MPVWSDRAVVMSAIGSCSRSSRRDRQCLTRREVGPLKILDDHHDRGTLGEAGQQRSARLERARIDGQIEEWFEHRVRHVSGELVGLQDEGVDIWIDTVDRASHQATTCPRHRRPRSR